MSTSLFDSPAEQEPSFLTRPSASGSEQAVWDAIARDHPRRFGRALAHLRWMDRMYAKYARRVL